MIRVLSALALVTAPSAGFAAQATSTTDFAIRAAPGAQVSVGVAPKAPSWTQIVTGGTGKASLSNAVAAVAALGRVTSTRRTAAHNRAVGGVRNSFHLSGRAIDVVPHRGVRHRDLEAALRRAGLSLIESLDEGDHSHFAFGSGRPASGSAPTAAPKTEVTEWRIVTAPRGATR